MKYLKTHDIEFTQEFIIENADRIIFRHWLYGNLVATDSRVPNYYYLSSIFEGEKFILTTELRRYIKIEMKPLMVKFECGEYIIEVEKTNA